jgi:hypothetical protein
MKKGYITCKVQFEIEGGKKTKIVNELYLVDAGSPTEAEAKVTKILTDEGETNFEVKATNPSKIVRVI